MYIHVYSVFTMYLFSELDNNIAKLIIRLKCRFFTDGRNILSAGWCMYSVHVRMYLVAIVLNKRTYICNFLFSFPLDLSNVHETFP